MGETALPQTDANDTLSARQRFDRKILLLFIVLAVTSVGIPSSLYLVTERTTAYQLVSSALGGLAFSFLVVGIPVYFRYRRSSLTSHRSIFRFIAILSIPLTAVTMLAIALASIYAPDVVEFERLSVMELLFIGVPMAASLFMTYLIMCYAVLVAASGVVGVLVALERLTIPRILGQVLRTSETWKPSLLGRAVKYLFNIPDVLDTRTLTIDPAEPRRRILLSDLRAPVLWQLSFGFILGIYISFNPFISDRSPEALLTMFSTLAIASALFPFLILPWFLFRRLGAGIVGQTKQFTLYDGVRSRVLRSYFAIGTIVIIVRLSIQEIAVAFETYVAAFSAFMGTVFLSALLSTFVYLNYFENTLTADVVEGVRETEVRIIGREKPEEGV